MPSLHSTTSVLLTFANGSSCRSEIAPTTASFVAGVGAKPRYGVNTTCLQLPNDVRDEASVVFDAVFAGGVFLHEESLNVRIVGPCGWITSN